MISEVLIAPEDAIVVQGAVHFIDATWYLPGDGRDGKEQYLKRRIPGAVYHDIDEVKDTASDLPHMAPDVEAMADWMGREGLASDGMFLIYDQNGFMASARVWWTFRRFGLNAKILNGGLRGWEEAGGDIIAGPAKPRRVVAPPKLFLVNDDVIGRADVLAHSKAGDCPILDARAPGRFTGKEPDPRPGMVSGHIPGSTNWFFKDLMTDNGRLKTGAELEALLPVTARGEQVICTCGSGVTAAVLYAALVEAGFEDVWLYDGSWTEWASRGDMPIGTSV